MKLCVFGGSGLLGSYVAVAITEKEFPLLFLLKRGFLRQKAKSSL